jgi:hypothetical protein
MGLRAMGCGHRLYRSGSRQGQLAGCCECGNDLSGSLRKGDIPW